MKKINLTINNLTVSVNDGSTILDAAETLGIAIPTLCYVPGYEPNATCMFCVVHELTTDSLILACSMPAKEGMIIETDTARVYEARKDTLDLLLSEHVGDCEAPCQRTCPTNMNIPLMIRQIKEKKFDEVLITVKKNIALPAAMGRICPAPCEKACNRTSYDNPVAICLLKRFVADRDLAKEIPYRPEIFSKSGKKVAVVGAGPAGLSAAYYLSRYGHDCSLFDRNKKPGGQLQYGVPADKLPRPVLDAEIEQILTLGVEFMSEQILGKNFSLGELRKDHDAVVLALGTINTDVVIDPDLQYSPAGITVNRKTFETSIPGVFAGGNVISEGKMAIRSAAHGKFIAYSVNRYVSGLSLTGYPQRFNSMMGKLIEGEDKEFIKEAEVFDRVEPAGGLNAGYTVDEAVNESKRCFHCDCRKPESCKLRQYSEKYGADRRRFKIDRRKPFRKIVQHELVNFEPGKCIHCNICVEITKKAGEKLGFTFINRGFDVQMTVPFNESLNAGLRKAAKECVDSCPTAALSWRNGEEGLHRDTT
ncbi:MAG: (2Fe-2S)-binding protein [Candidatus Latescibacteria bacterium]|nr:(2Fe-2S)-binding protein [Candidatus Latescibacterota bacterium]